ncbi:DUF4333 domain-containing protein [Streptomyces olivochromogenes]|uniref:DUF4333 domain-containing protein n=1 Tax=Streptomyces olivochromogenes TaxID=1963 RepID=UPI001F43009E|nr:DUF4333 domain-containing protein [Streptomyces olivochromogenes]MCF3132255.1 DUF4333 domain-containing protein [Streptomyces olivochromogenes]
MAKVRLSAAAWGLSAIAVGTLIVGCSVSVNTGHAKPKLLKDKLGDTVATRLAATTGQPKPDVTCPEDLVGEVGNTTRCTLTTGDGSSLGVTVTVTSVDGDDVNFHIKADETPTPAAN